MSNNVYITNLSAVLPNQPVSNQQMEQVLGQVGEHRSRAKSLILRSNKIKSRHYAIDPLTGLYNYTNASLAAAALKGLFSDNDVSNIDNYIM